MLISPAEPPALRKIGTVNAIPETYGADVLCMRGTKRLGIQRKEVKDFLASVDDNRLTKELMQMKALDQAVLLVEGEWTYGNDGKLQNQWGRAWTRTQINGLLFGILSRGVWLITSTNLSHTIDTCRDLEAWWKKDDHKAFSSRTGPVNVWGTKMDRDFGTWVLQSFPGIGPQLAERIYDACDGVPLTLSVSKEELMKVEGMGKKKVEALMRVLGVGDE